MSPMLSEPLTELYDQDETAWLDEMARLVRLGRMDQLDCNHLAEYLSDMARRDKREVKSRLALLIAHVLKWNCQPKKRSRSWLVSVEQQKQELRELLASATLNRHAETVLAEAYADGVHLAAVESGLPASAFPVDCPYTISQLDAWSPAGDLPTE